jgi:hypothetical protein
MGGVDWSHHGLYFWRLIFVGRSWHAAILDCAQQRLELLPSAFCL